ncbi:hypothetical protein AZE42_05844 [Rhizopogon vesiculosus]|uniref:Uncharacterized protein n=1 Tax=Rhizopogon vesiculosus TaxID=180088 RepID=A0A1J8QNQ4_9AGAM|nr:hypothetical protein AZE42_05844 [Rhizopogon vesiculosus]
MSDDQKALKAEFEVVRRSVSLQEKGTSWEKFEQGSLHHHLSPRSIHPYNTRPPKRSKSPVLSNGRATTGRVRPVGSLGAEKISSNFGHTFRAISSSQFYQVPAKYTAKGLSSRRRTSSLFGVRPVICAGHKSHHAAPLAGREQRHGRSAGDTTSTFPQCSRPTTGRVPGPSSMRSTHRRSDVRGGRKILVPKALPETGGTNMARTRVQKTRPLSVKPSTVGPLPKPPISNNLNPISTEAELQTASSQASQGTSARMAMASFVLRSRDHSSEGPCIKAAARRVLVRAAPLLETDMAQTRVRKTRPMSLKRSAVGPLPKLEPPISQCDPKNNPILTKVELQTTTSQASCRRAIASRSTKQVVGQKNPVRGRRIVSKALKPKPVLNELIDAIIAGIHNPDTVNPRRSRDCEREPSVQIISHMLVLQDIKRPSYMSMGCRIRRPSWRPPHQDGESSAARIPCVAAVTSQN